MVHLHTMGVKPMAMKDYITTCDSGNKPDGYGLVTKNALNGVIKRMNLNALLEKPSRIVYDFF